MRFYCGLRILKTCPVTVRKRKKKTIIRRKTIIKIKASPHRDLVKRRVLREVVLVLVLLVGVRIPRRHRGVAVQVVLTSRDREVLVVMVVHFVAGVIVDTLRCVSKVTEDVLFVVRRDTGLFNAHRASRSPNHPLYRH
ncbi:hypothetical protein ACFX1W_013346 [Malus domestica]